MRQGMAAPSVRHSTTCTVRRRLSGSGSDRYMLRGAMGAEAVRSTDGEVLAVLDCCLQPQDGMASKADVRRLQGVERRTQRSCWVVLGRSGRSWAMLHGDQAQKANPYIPMPFSALTMGRT